MLRRLSSPPNSTSPFPPSKNTLSQGSHQHFNLFRVLTDMRVAVGSVGIVMMGWSAWRSYMSDMDSPFTFHRRVIWRVLPSYLSMTKSARLNAAPSMMYIIVEY